MVTVYTKPDCPQCDLTKRTLDRRGLAYDTIDIAAPENAAALQWIMEDLGYRQAPVVVLDENNHWSGFRPDLITNIPQQEQAPR